MTDNEKYLREEQCEIKGKLSTISNEDILELLIEHRKEYDEYCRKDDYIPWTAEAEDIVEETYSIILNECLRRMGGDYNV